MNYKVKIWVGSRWIGYESPNKKDHLLRVPRKLFPQSVNDEIDEDNPTHPIKYGEVLCDACSEPINHPHVWVLVLGNPWRCWGTLCERCRERYHEKPAYIIADEVYRLKNGKWQYGIPKFPFGGKKMNYKGALERYKKKVR